MTLKEFWKKNGLHIQAAGILILLLMVWSMYYKTNQQQKQIVEKCGWGEEDYYCYCEKSEAMEIKNKLEELQGKGVGDLNVSGEGLGVPILYLSGDE